MNYFYQNKTIKVGLRSLKVKNKEFADGIIMEERGHLSLEMRCAELSKKYCAFGMKGGNMYAWRHLAGWIFNSNES